MPDFFSIAHAFTSKWEGGFVDHPNDPGGATNFGISLRWLKDAGLDINDDGIVDKKDVRALTPDMAATLYRKYFWNDPRIFLLHPLVAVAVYDGAVNMGIARSIRHLQEFCNVCGQSRRVTEDGVLGPLTLAAVQATFTPLLVAEGVVDKRLAYYDRLASNPRFTPFQRGWNNRAYALLAYVRELAVKGVA